MASKNPRQLVMLGAVIVLLLGAGWYWYAYAPATAEAPVVASKGKSSTKRGAAASGSRTTAPDVHLEALDARATKLEGTTRNPFRFKAKPAPPPPPPVMAPPPPPAAPPVPAGPPPPPPLPPITLKFIGAFTIGGQKVAMLVDGQGHAMDGREGDIIEGRYKIIRIGVESIEMSYVDGRGRQTIRMGGT